MGASGVALIIVAWVFTALLLLLVVVSVAASRGALPLNHFFGVKLPALTRSEPAWRAGHAASILPASVAFVVALACSVIGLLEPVAYAGTVVAMIGGVAWVFVRATRAANAVGRA